MATTVTAAQVVLPNVWVGTYGGTTAAQTIQIGFRPSYILGLDITNGTTVFIWYSGDTSHAWVQLTTAGFAQKNDAITVTDHGFSLPASNSDVNNNGDTYLILAVR